MKKLYANGCQWGAMFGYAHCSHHFHKGFYMPFLSDSFFPDQIEQNCICQSFVMSMASIRKMTN